LIIFVSVICSLAFAVLYSYLRGKNDKRGRERAEDKKSCDDVEIDAAQIYRNGFDEKI